MSNYEKNISTMKPILNDELSLDHPPRGIRMERGMDGGTVIRIRFLSVAVLPILFFTLFWNGIVSLFVISVIAETAATFGWNVSFSFFEIDGKSKPLWFLWLILTPFVVIGFWLIFYVLFKLLGRCEIRLGTDKGSVFSGIGLFGKTKHFTLKSVKTVGVLERPDTDGTLPCSVAITMNNGREIRFPLLGKMRETWLAFALGKLLGRTT